MRFGLPQRLHLFMVRAAAWVCFLVLAYAGFAKMFEPAPAERFVRDFLFSGDAHVGPFIRSVAVAEVALALTLTHTRTRRVALGVCMAVFAMFAVTHIFHSRDAAPVSGCGCLGGGSLEQAIPPLGWAAINGTISLLAWAGASDWRWTRLPSPEIRPDADPISLRETAR